MIRLCVLALSLGVIIPIAQARAAGPGDGNEGRFVIPLGPPSPATRKAPDKRPTRARTRKARRQKAVQPRKPQQPPKHPLTEPVAEPAPGTGPAAAEGPPGLAPLSPDTFIGPRPGDLRRKRRRRRARQWPRSHTVTPLTAAEMKVRISGDEIELPDQVLFRSGRVTFNTKSAPVLRQTVELLQATPEIKLVLIEGHTDAQGDAPTNQRLSEARAGAVRQALVQAGVAPERLVAYGFGEHRPIAGNHRPSGRQRNRRVVLRLIKADQQALVHRETRQWGDAVVVAVRGEARWRHSMGGAIQEEPDQADPAAGGWSLLQARTSLPEGVEIATGPEGEVALRLPDLSHVVLRAGGHLALTKVFSGEAEGPDYLAARLLSGRLQVSLTPRAANAGHALIALSGASVEAPAPVERAEGDQWAAFEVMMTPSGRGQVRVDRGTARVSSGEATSVVLSRGQVMPLGGAEPAEASAALAGPGIKAPLEGEVARQTHLVWRPVEQARSYEVEVALDVHFHQVVFRQVSAEARLLTPLLPVGPVFWRVRAIGQRGHLGRASGIHRVVVKPRAGEDAPPDGPPMTAHR